MTVLIGEAQSFVLSLSCLYPSTQNSSLLDVLRETQFSGICWYLMEFTLDYVIEWGTIGLDCLRDVLIALHRSLLMPIFNGFTVHVAA